MDDLGAPLFFGNTHIQIYNAKGGNFANRDKRPCPKNTAVDTDPTVDHPSLVELHLSSCIQVNLKFRMAGIKKTLKRNSKITSNTPPKFNIAPEKWWLEDYFPIGKVTFQGLC